jgi:hypothetical protein
MDGKGDTGGGSGLLEWSGISADLARLRQLAVQLRASVEVSLTPRTEQAFPPFNSGASFGTTSPSLDMHAVRHKYSDCLDAAVDQLVDQIDTSSRLVDVVTEIAARYGSVDGLASATLTDLQDAFVAAARDDRLRLFGGGANPNAGGL